LCDSLGKDSWVFRVKQEVYSGQFAVFFSSVPVTGEDLTLDVESVNKDWAPFTAAFRLLKKPFPGDWREVVLLVVSE
jgi:hypothetical protein